MKMKLHKTKNDLREKTRRAMIDLLNQELADVLDLGLQTKQAHWNVKGPHFIGLHELFDKVAEELEELTEDMAERAVELGGVALVFAMHEVLVRGHSLRRIETAMQRLELSLLTTLSGKQRSLIPDGQPVILTIIITKLNSDEKRGEGVSGALHK